MLTTVGFALAVFSLVAIWFVALWLAICHLVASVSGWKRLRALYATGPFEGSTSTFAGYVGRSRFRGRALIAGATPAGLYLNVVALFRFGIGPLFIPWRDITVSSPSTVGPVSLVTFEFPKAATSLRAPEDVAKRLLEGQRGLA